MIVPAVIAKTQRELNEMLSRVRGKVDRIMLDVMDGDFVAGTSLGFNFNLTPGFEYEAHLMVRRPLDWVRDKADEIDIAILHVETLDDIRTAIDYVKSRGVGVTLAINPETGIEAVLPYLIEVQCILMMTVSPGKYGGRFLPETLEKVRRLREIDSAIPIEVDGGMNPVNAKLARDYGANIFASGSYIFGSDDVCNAIEKLKEVVS